MDNIIFNLVVTEKCNLNCHYCYMRNNESYMTPDIIDNLFDNYQQLLDILNGKTFHIDFFGGEPLLNWDLIIYTVERFKKLRYNTSFCIISNLLLLDNEKIEYIKNNHIGISWSFDGLWNVDIRTKINGSSTLDDYLNKLDTIKRVTNGCKCTITPYQMYSKYSLSDNCRYMVDELNLYPEYGISKDCWTSEAVNIFAEQLDEFADLYIDYVKRGIFLRNFFTLYLTDTVLSKKTSKRPFVCFAGNNGISIMPNGDIYPCARYGTNHCCSMGNIKTPLKIKSFKYIIENNPLNLEKCKECEMRLWCNSGCQYIQQCNHFTPLENYCKLYKILYKKALYVFESLKDNREWVRRLHYENYFSCNN